MTKAKAKGGAGVHLPQPVARRLRERCRTEKAVVVTSNKGVASRVYGLEEYLRKRETARANKPWMHRKARRAVPDPLGSVDGAVKEPVRRETIYD